ncbi:MAG: intradiol ring-cleavage dioxygenase [Armatimonadota bacterium]|nr:intradiol ring-cleavage dioxygenase [Armatimonadota bacterium]
MHDRPSARWTRREFLQTSVAVPGALALAASAWRLIDLAPFAAFAQGQVLPPTPACPDPDDVTPAQTEGPFYRPRSPQRTSLLEPGVTGTKIVVAGYVLTRTCRPVPRALVDFWHADDRGEYDNVGYRLRGHQFTDEAGRYYLETIVPGLYPGRTRHFHVKVQAANRPVLTTQLYFPGEPRNQTDRIFHPRLLLDVREAAGGKVATFNFVLDIR